MNDGQVQNFAAVSWTSQRVDSGEDGGGVGGSDKGIEIEAVLGSKSSEEVGNIILLEYFLVGIHMRDVDSVKGADKVDDTLGGICESSTNSVWASRLFTAKNDLSQCPRVRHNMQRGGLIVL